MSNDKLNKNTDELEQELREAPSFDAFAAEMDERFLAGEVGRDLSALIKSRKIKKSELFAAANIHENYGYQLLNGTRYPSREVLLSIFLSMQMSYEEVNLFLRTHGFTPLYVRRKFDAAVIYCLMHGFSAMKCNELLFEEGLPLLTKEK
ncbi:MAG: helix-turn-helix transcriptional regulator [Lachnospiraceae bacterium]|nr:helix-turn-helix transcriptional regulator [Lachnospiraceae bacterium]